MRGVCLYDITTADGCELNCLLLGVQFFEDKEAFLKGYNTDKIRNVALVGQASAGKTSLAEAMLYTAGATNRLGKIEDGTTVSDFQKDEIDRKFSIGLSLLHSEWKDMKLNIVDTPGYTDFLADARAALRVTDIGAFVLDASSGVEVGSEVVWQFAEEEKTPRLLIINMLDREHTDFDALIAKAAESFNTNNLKILQFPLNAGPGFSEIVDVISRKKHVYTKDGKGSFKEEDLPAELQDRVEELYSQLVEGVAESDDALLEKFFEEGTLSDEEIRTGITNALVTGSLVPIFATAATANIGVASLMDFLVNYAPAPNYRLECKGLDNKDTEVSRKIDASDSLSMFVFKTLSESHLGELYLMRVMSGSLSSGVDLANIRSREKERSGQIYLINGKARTEIDKVMAGDLCALVKLKNTSTGDTLSDARSAVIYPELKFPEAVIRVAIEPKSRGDEEKISGGLSQLNSEDPTFSVEHDRELRQMIISGQGELHLTIIIDRLKSKYGVDVNQLEPRIPYRETITTKADSKYRHKKQSGGAGQFAEVWMRVEPQARGEGISFVNTLVGQNVDRVFVPSVEKGVMAASVEGIFAGYPVIDVKADFYDGKMHPVDSKDIAFQIAGRGAFREAFLNAKPILLEPIYNLEVIVPEDYTGDVMGDISTRRGKVQGMEAVGNKQMVKAQAPLAELYRYSTALRSVTQGRGIHRMSFSHYDPVPHEIQQRLVSEYKKAREEGNK